MAFLGSLRTTLSILRKHPSGFLGLIIVSCFLLVALIGPYIVPYPEQAWGALGLPRERFKPPSLEHIFGTDDYGRDVFSRVVVGARLSLLAGISVVGLALLIGVPLGMLCGLVGGKLSYLIESITEVFLAFPPILLALIIAATLGGGFWNAVLALAVTWWPWYARVAATLTRSVKEQPFVYAARLLGFSDLYIALKHVLPNVIGPIIVQATLDIGTAILEMAGLSFLGLGAKPPMPDWGLMVSLGKNALPYYWWIPVFPGLAIFIVTLGFNMLGDAARELIDPRLRLRWLT